MHPNPLLSSSDKIAEVALVMHVGVVVLHVVVQWVKRLQVVSTLLTGKKWFAIDVKFSVLLQGLFWHQRYLALSAWKISRVIMGFLMPLQFCWSQEGSATKFALKKTWKKEYQKKACRTMIYLHVSSSRSLQPLPFWTFLCIAYIGILFSKNHFDGSAHGPSSSLWLETPFCKFYISIQSCPCVLVDDPKHPSSYRFSTDKVYKLFALRDVLQIPSNHISQSCSFHMSNSLSLCAFSCAEPGTKAAWNIADKLNTESDFCHSDLRCQGGIPKCASLVSQSPVTKGTRVRLVLVLALEVLIQGSNAIEHLITLVTVKCVALCRLVEGVALVHMLENGGGREHLVTNRAHFPLNNFCYADCLQSFLFLF